MEGRDLVEKLLHRDPSKRIDASRAIQHPWITLRTSGRKQMTETAGDDDLPGPDDFACTIC